MSILQLGFLQASQAFDLGYFYFEHSEKGYCFQTHGTSLGYEIGGDAGIKAIGKLQISQDDQIYFLRAKNYLSLTIPIKFFSLCSTYGIETTRHKLHVGGWAMQSQATIFGFGLCASPGPVSLSASCSHMHYSKFELETKESDFLKITKLLFPHKGSLSASISCLISPCARLCISGEYQKSYLRKSKTIALECSTKISF